MGERRGHLFLVGESRPPERRDSELVQAFLRGEPGAAADLWERCYPMVRRVVFRLAGPRLDVEDVIQEIFLRLYRQLPGLRDQEALGAFALAIAVRVVKGDQRGRWLKRWLGLFHDGQIPERETRNVDLEAREALAHFYRILEGLSPQHRTVFVLRHIEGMELVQVSAVVGVSPATLKRWLPRICRRVFSQAKADSLLAPYLVVNEALMATENKSAGRAGEGLNELSEE